MARLHSLIAMILHMYLTYMQSFVNLKDATNVYKFKNSLMDYEKINEVQLILLKKSYENLD